MSYSLLLIALLVSLTTGTGLACVGDCDGDNRVSISELVTGVRAVLGGEQSGTCEPFDLNADGNIRIDELGAGVRNSLFGCSEETFSLCGCVDEFPDRSCGMRGVTLTLEPGGTTAYPDYGSSTFCFEGLPPGDYTVKVDPPCNPFGCWAREAKVTITDDDLFVVFSHRQPGP